MAQAQEVRPGAPDFESQHVNLRRGDIIGKNLSYVLTLPCHSSCVGIVGFPTRTNPKKKEGSGDTSGELSISATEIILLTPCLHQVCLDARRNVHSFLMATSRSLMSTMGSKTLNSDSASDTST